MIVPKRFRLLVPLGMLVLTPWLLTAQEARVPAVFDSTGASWVYASYFRIPWARVDSLLKLQRFLPAWRARAIEMGCLVDASILIHHTGNEYNVVRSATYRSFRAIGPVGVTTGGECGDRAWRQVVPDSTLRAALRQGNDWVFLGSPHYDVIYWVPYPGRR